MLQRWFIGLVSIFVLQIHFWFNRWWKVSGVMNLKCISSLKNVRTGETGGFLIPRLRAEHWPQIRRSPQKIYTVRAQSGAQLFLEGPEAWWVCVSEVGPQFEQMFDEAEIQEQEHSWTIALPLVLFLYSAFVLLQPTLHSLSLSPFYFVHSLCSGLCCWFQNKASHNAKVFI